MRLRKTTFTRWRIKYEINISCIIKRGRSLKERYGIFVATLIAADLFPTLGKTVGEYRSLANRRIINVISPPL